MDIPDFKGDWSYTQKEMIALFKHIEFNESYSILEFGLGESTNTIYEYFKKYVDKLTYIGYETDSYYSSNINNNITVNMYDINNINSVILPDIKFDLILIDGPYGEYRSLWYKKLKGCVKPGTILLVDDFNHYNSFSTELDSNFDYILLDHSDEPFRPNGEHSWKIVKIISSKEYEYHSAK
jgi:hypothetical protein